MARKYDLDCPVACTLDVIGDRWAILILRDLFHHAARRFQDFEATLPGLTPSVLSARLKSLEGDGVIAARIYEVHPPRFEYFLTPKGRELGPILRAMKSWGDKHADGGLGDTRGGRLTAKRRRASKQPGYQARETTPAS